MDIEKYMEKYNTFTKSVVFHLEIGQGGIGDFMKFFGYLLYMCDQHNIRFYYLITNNPLEKYITLRYPQMYITSDKLVHSKQIQMEDNFAKLEDGGIYMYSLKQLYRIFDTDHYAAMKNIIELSKIFILSNDIIEYAHKYIHDTQHYISIHLRLGDKFLETDMNYVLCKSDQRQYNEERIYNCIEQNMENTIWFFCDNKAYKQKLKEKYPFIHITDFDIGHTSFTNTTDLQVFHAIVEFYILSQSQKIYIGSNSGFPLTAALFKNTPISILYK